MSINKRINKVFYLLFDGEGDGDDEAAAAAAAAAAAEAEAAALAAKKSFTQDEVNKMLAIDRRKNSDKMQKTIGELEALKKSKNLTEQQQADLSKRIEELQDQLLTKEQLAQRDREKLKTDYDGQIVQLTGDRDTWRTRYEKALVVNAIHAAAKEHGAIDNNQIIALIQAHSPRVVQELGESGEPKDIFTPKVKMLDYDTKEKKEVTLDFTISEAVKRLKEKPENFNLFAATVNGGLGLGSGTGRGDSDAPPLTDPAAYRKWRKKNLLSN